MNKVKALSVVSRQHPCPHDNADTRLGNGKVWAKCDDCGVTFQQDQWPHARASAKEFGEALDVLTNLVEQA